MRRPLVVGNWKMNGTRSSTGDLLRRIVSGLHNAKNAEVAACVPFVFIQEALEQVTDTGLIIGAQNVADQKDGAFTGEISAGMLAEFGCRLAIVGHSERRLLYNESNELVARRFGQAIEGGIQPILCIGETLEQREQNATFKVIDEQLLTVLENIGVDSFSEAVVAYEPVWAIGTGETATPEQAQAVHAHIRKTINRFDADIAENIRILYGGSVKSDNSKALFSMMDIDGGLIGGASLDADSFLAIVDSANTVE